MKRVLVGSFEAAHASLIEEYRAKAGAVKEKHEGLGVTM